MMNYEAPFFRHQTVGQVDVFSLNDGIRNAPLTSGFVRNASVEEMKTALLDAGLADTGVPVPFTALAVKRPDGLILIDAGTGGFPVYGPTCGLMLQSLMLAGFQSPDVKTILITHLHGDHIYGLADRHTNAQVFPNARIIVPSAELAWWTRPEVDRMDLGPTRRGLSHWIRTTLATWPNVVPVDMSREVDVLPEITPVAARGHSPATVSYVLRSASQKLFVTADVSLLPAFFVRNPDWEPSLDQDPATAVATRKRIFARVVEEGARITGTHWPHPNIGTMSRFGAGYALSPGA